MTRREIRETVFKIVFGVEFTESAQIREQAELELDTATLYDEEEMAPVVMTDAERTYILDRVCGVSEHLAEIDQTISEISEGWRLNRIGKAELAILRLAVYEMRYDDDIPVKVAINEAVELSKKFCDVEAKSFVNALLAKLANE